MKITDFLFLTLCLQTQVYSLGFQKNVEVYGGAGFSSKPFSLSYTSGIYSGFSIESEIFHLWGNFNAYILSRRVFYPQYSKELPYLLLWNNISSLMFLSVNSGIVWTPFKGFNFSAGYGNRRSVPLFQDSLNNEYPYLEAKWLGNSLSFSFQMHFLIFDSFSKIRYFHSIDIKPGNSVKISLWEAIIQPIEDQRFIELWYVTGLGAFWRPVEFSIGSPDNSFIGGYVTFEGKNKSIELALLVDDFYFQEFKKGKGWWGNKWASHLSFSCSSGKTTGKLLIRYIRPYTFSYISTHGANMYRQMPLGPLEGANSLSTCIIATHRHGSSLHLEYGTMAILQGRENSQITFVGSDISRSYQQRPSDYGISWIYGDKYFKVAGWLLINTEIARKGPFHIHFFTYSYGVYINDRKDFWLAFSSGIRITSMENSLKVPAIHPTLFTYF